MDDSEANADIEPILAELRWRTGVDFSRYRPATIRRRVHNRMISVGAAWFDEYLVHLRQSVAEAELLLDRLAIKVSRFYRHAPAWDELRATVLPALAREHRRVRIWSAACGYGEEVYTLAMLLDEAGLDGTMLGTDIDSSAIAAAEQGRYPRSAFDELPPGLVARYVLAAADGDAACEVLPALRRRVRFARHDLLFAAAPERDCDIVCCRNMLIYLRPDAREEAFNTLVGALRNDGHLLLGEAEWPSPAFTDALAPLSRASRLFRKVGDR